MVSQILIVMIAAIAVTIVAERRNIQPPLLLALVGLAASFVPSLLRSEYGTVMLEFGQTVLKARREALIAAATPASSLTKCCAKPSRAWTFRKR